MTLVLALLLHRHLRRGNDHARTELRHRVGIRTVTRIRFDLPQFDAAKVALGSAVFVQIAGQRIHGSVVRLTPGLVGEGNTRRAEAILHYDDEQRSVASLQLLPGARMMAWLEIGGQEEVVEVPRSATTTTAGLTRAWVVEQGRLEERLLSVFRVEGDRLWVRAGLDAGERLVRAPLPDFRLGEKVVP